MNHLRSGIPTQHYEFSSIAGRPLDAPSAGPHSPDSLLSAQPTPTALQALPPREHPAESERQMRAQHVKQGHLFSTSGPIEKDAAATQQEKANARLRLNTSFVQLKSKVLAERAVQKQRTRTYREGHSPRTPEVSLTKPGKCHALILILKKPCAALRIKANCSRISTPCARPCITLTSHS